MRLYLVDLLSSSIIYTVISSTPNVTKSISDDMETLNASISSSRHSSFNIGICKHCFVLNPKAKVRFFSVVT